MPTGAALAWDDDRCQANDHLKGVRRLAAIPLWLGGSPGQLVNAVADAQDYIHHHPERDDEADADRLPGSAGIVERPAVVLNAVRLALEQRPPVVVVAALGQLCWRRSC